MRKRLTRWDAFTASELQGLDELVRSFGPMRAYNSDLVRLADEIAGVMRQRGITPFGAVDVAEAHSAARTGSMRFPA